MSEKRASYTGPSGTGVDITIPLDNGEYRNVHVEHGHQLPTDIDGVKVPTKFRDSLLEQDDWSEVKQATGTDTRPAKGEKE